ncbi:hypothetical protein HK102_001803 [Quaeritorhiza haematococci]|nr:hypothetical protein HK102_001803 [Quaeritorhiza haematococci]
MKTTLAFVATALISLAGLQSVDAHASVNPPVAIPGSYSAHSIRIGHGCGKSPTNNVTVVIPEGVSSVKPRQITGWTINITKKPLNPPIQTEGRTINETVDTVSWFGGNLADEYYEDFGLSLRLPPGDDGTKLWFKVYQMCLNGSNPWIEIPEAGKASPDFPAAALTLMKNGTMAKDPHAHGDDEGKNSTAAAAQSSKSGAGASVVGSGVGVMAVLGAVMSVVVMM